MLRSRCRLAFASALAAFTLVACGERATPGGSTASSAVGAGSAPASAPAAAAVAPPAQAAEALVAYLRGAEIQAETDAQREVLRRALRDLASLPPAELRAARYPGADGRPGERDLAQVLRAHLVPASPRGVDLDELLAGRDSEAGRAALRETLARLEPPVTK